MKPGAYVEAPRASTPFALLRPAATLNCGPMERDLAGVQLSAADFRRLAAAFRLDIRFPKDFKAWTALVEAGARTLAEQRAPVAAVALDMDDFVKWCLRVDVAPYLDALRAYLILIHHRQHIPGKSPTGPRAKPRASQHRGPPKGSAPPYSTWPSARSAPSAAARG